MNHFKVRNIRSSGVSPDDIAANSSQGSPQSVYFKSKGSCSIESSHVHVAASQA